jgi:hypothetical protein
MDEGFMNEQDQEHLRCLFAGFAMAGLVMREGVGVGGLEIDAWVMADRMMATRNTNYKDEPEEGIVAIKKRVRKTKE